MSSLYIHANTYAQDHIHKHQHIHAQYDPMPTINDHWAYLWVFTHFLQVREEKQLH